MTGRQIEATARGLELIARGVSVRVAAKEVGVAPSTLTRAKKRASTKPAQPARTTEGETN